MNTVEDTTGKHERITKMVKEFVRGKVPYPVEVEILTPDEVASLIKVSVGQVYELCKERHNSGDMRINPLPCVRWGESIRFIKGDVERWMIEALNTARNEVEHTQRQWDRALVELQQARDNFRRSQALHVEASAWLSELLGAGRK